VFCDIFTSAELTILQAPTVVTRLVSTMLILGVNLGPLVGGVWNQSKK
jgi:hypothetical protein